MRFVLLTSPGGKGFKRGAGSDLGQVQGVQAKRSDC